MWFGIRGGFGSLRLANKEAARFAFDCPGDKDVACQPGPGGKILVHGNFGGKNFKKLAGFQRAKMLPDQQQKRIDIDT